MRTIALSLLFLPFMACHLVDNTPLIYRSHHYAVYSNAVYEMSDKAVATSPHTITSTYRLVAIPTTYHALREFEQQGYYINDKGDTVYQTDLEHTNGFDTTVWVEPQQESALVMGAWQQEGNLAAYPSYHSDQLLVDALYNMALDELSTYDNWRDAELAIYMSLAYVAPEISMTTLRGEVSKSGILYHTDKPLSTTHLAWGIAAWEIYLFTGDSKWLRYAYKVLSKTAHIYSLLAYDQHTQLMRGEAAYLNKQEMNYPHWMLQVDKFQSFSLSTNTLYCEMYNVLAKMASELSKDVRPYMAQYALLKSAINYRFWLPESRYYGQYLYGDVNPILAQGCDNLGQSLAVLFDIAPLEQQASLVSHTPLTTYGTPSNFPTPSDSMKQLSLYVQSLWNLAAAKADNQLAVVQGIAALYRNTALSATHKGILPTESTIAAHFGGIAGNIATIYRLYYGMQFTTDGIYFSPYVPRVLRGTKLLSDFLYRDATLQIELKGYGNRVEAFMIDDVMQTTSFLPANLKGRHRIEIVLANNTLDEMPTNIQDDVVLPPTSLLVYDDKVIIENYPHNGSSLLYVDAHAPLTLDTSYYCIAPTDTLTTIAIAPISDKARVGYSGRPVSLITSRGEQWIEAEDFAVLDKSSNVGFRGKGAVCLDAASKKQLTLSVTVEEEGFYLVDVRYAPLSYGTSIRSLYINGSREGTVVMPSLQGNEQWGSSSVVRIHLPKGESTLSLRYLPPLDTNNVQVDAIRVRRLSSYI